jgi:hypothetical protein
VDIPFQLCAPQLKIPTGRFCIRTIFEHPKTLLQLNSPTNHNVEGLLELAAAKAAKAETAAKEVKEVKAETAETQCTHCTELSKRHATRKISSTPKLH